MVVLSLSEMGTGVILKLQATRRYRRCQSFHKPNCNFETNQSLKALVLWQLKDWSKSLDAANLYLSNSNISHSLLTVWLLISLFIQENPVSIAGHMIIFIKQSTQSSFCIFDANLHAPIRLL